MLRSVEVREYMSTSPVTMRPEMNIYQAAHAILANKISGAPVIDENQNLIGVLSELDCLRAILKSIYTDGTPGTALVGEMMSREVEINHPHDNIVDIANSMLDHKHRRRPIVVHGKLVGQLTCRQILNAVKEFGENGNAPSPS